MPHVAAKAFRRCGAAKLPGTGTTSIEAMKIHRVLHEEGVAQVLAVPRKNGMRFFEHPEMLTSRNDMSKTSYMCGTYEVYLSR